MPLTQGPFPSDAADRMADFTELLATVVGNAPGRAELAGSRARIVAAADEAGRRIERDLHDGTQQCLVSLGLQLRLAQSMVPAGSAPRSHGPYCWRESPYSWWQVVELEAGRDYISGSDREAGQHAARTQ
jgi:Histidine kinase